MIESISWANVDIAILIGVIIAVLAAVIIANLRRIPFLGNFLLPDPRNDSTQHPRTSIMLRGGSGEHSSAQVGIGELRDVDNRGGTININVELGINQEPSSTAPRPTTDDADDENGDDEPEEESSTSSQLDVAQEFINSGKVDEAESLLGAIDVGGLSKTLAYRRLALQGHLRIRQGQTAEGVKLLQEAIKHTPASKSALANSVYIKIIEDQYDEAIRLGLNLLKKHPDNDLIAANVLRGRILSKYKDKDILKGIPSSAQHGEEFGQLLIEVKFQNGLDWQEEGEAFLREYPDNLLVKVRLNEDVISKALDRRGGKVSASDRATDLDEKHRLSEASRQLAHIWRQEVAANNTEVFSAIPQHASLGFSLIGDFDSSEALLREGIKALPDNLDLKHLLTDHLGERGKDDQALEVYESIGESGTLETKFRFANALFRVGRKSEARRIVEDLLRLDIGDASVNAAMCLSLAEQVIEDGDVVTARRLLDEAKQKDPQDARRYVLEVQLLKFQQAPVAEINAVIDEAVREFNPHPHQEINTSFAIFLRRQGRPRDALRVMSDVSVVTASQELRLYLELLIECREFERFQDVRKRVPGDVIEAMNFETLDVNFLVNSNQLAKAEPLVKKLALHLPTNFNNAFFYINLLVRLNKNNEALRFIETLPKPSLIDGKKPILEMAAAYLRLGKAEDALQLIYSAKIWFPDDQEVTEAYLSFLMSSELRNSELLKAPTVVAPNAAVAVNLAGEQKIWVIEPKGELRQTEFYIGPDQGMARQLLGHAQGDEVLGPQSMEPYGKIDWIKRKEVHLMHTLLENFEQILPDSNVLRRVEMDFDSDDPLGPIRKELQANQDDQRKVWQMYQDKVPVFRFASQLMSAMVHTFYEQYPSVFESNLLVCAGTSEELAGAFGAITQNEKRGFVADLLTCWIIHRNGWLPIIRKVLGPPFITQDTKDRLAEYLEQERQSGESTGVMTLQNGEPVMIKMTKEQQDAVRKTDEEFSAFLNRLTVPEVLPTPAEQAQELEGTVDRNFYDDASAAKQSDILLLSEDWGYRQLAEQSIGCVSVWLQPVFQEAYRRGHIDVNDYQKAICLLLQHRHQFTSIDIDTLLYLEDSDESDFRTHASTAFNFTDEWRPLVALTVHFIDIMWAKYEEDKFKAKTSTADILEIWRNYPHLTEFEEVCKAISQLLPSKEAQAYVGEYPNIEEGGTPVD